MMDTLRDLGIDELDIEQVIKDIDGDLKNGCCSIDGDQGPR
jgi:hypothetical protein